MTKDHIKEMMEIAEANKKAITTVYKEDLSIFLLQETLY